MSEWISVNERLPYPFEPVWVYWRDRQVVVGYRTYTGKDSVDQPAYEGWYSIEDGKGRWANWWMPIEKPKPPENL